MNSIELVEQRKKQKEKLEDKDWNSYRDGYFETKFILENGRMPASHEYLQTTKDDLI